MEAALHYMVRGDLVPDEIVLGMVQERVRCLRCCGGFLLDGFPRTVAQAKALEKLLKKENVPLTAVLNYELPIDQIVARLSGRRTCSKCKAVFHVTNLPPRVKGICDHCGGELIQREDDRPESVRVRMEAYEKSTRPLIDFYQKRGLLVSISAEGSPEEIYQRTRLARAGVIAHSTNPRQLLAAGHVQNPARADGALDRHQRRGFSTTLPMSRRRAEPAWRRRISRARAASLAATKATKRPSFATCNGSSPSISQAA